MTIDPHSPDGLCRISKDRRAIMRWRAFIEAIKQYRGSQLI
jgi:hypothetical protein